MELNEKVEQHEKRIRLLGTQVDVNAEVQSIETFSGHADYKGLLNWLKNFSPKPKKVFICHGDEDAITSFSEKVEKIGIKTHVPIIKEEIIL